MGGVGLSPLVEPGPREPMAFKSQDTSCPSCWGDWPCLQGRRPQGLLPPVGRGQGGLEALWVLEPGVWGAVPNSGSSPASQGSVLQSRYLRPLPTPRSFSLPSLVTSCSSRAA